MHLCVHVCVGCLCFLVLVGCRVCLCIYVFACVCVCWASCLYQQQPVALKRFVGHWLAEAFFFSTSSPVLVFDHQASLLASLRHRNIIKFLGACTAAPNSFLVTEYAQHGSLYGFLESWW